MRISTPKYFGTLTLLLSLSAFCVADLVLPKQWSSYASAPKAYEVGRESKISRSGNGSGFLRSLTKVEMKHHVLLYQEISSLNHRGRELSLTGFLKTKNVSGWSGFWVRAEDAQGKVLAFKNMMDAPVRGTTDWTSYNMTVKIPAQSAKIVFGALLAGEGEVWVDDFKLETQGTVERLEELKQRIRSLPAEPENLDFEA